MKKTFISFIVAMSIAIYSMCGFAVFADVGVAVLAILNAMRCMNVRK